MLNKGGPYDVMEDFQKIVSEWVSDEGIQKGLDFQLEKGDLKLIGHAEILCGKLYISRPKTLHADYILSGVEVEIEWIKGWFEPVFNEFPHKEALKSGNSLFVWERGFYVCSEMMKLDEEYITLSNVMFLVNKYGKYKPNLSFISQYPCVERFFKKIDSRSLNLDRGDLSVIYGEFFVSKKGTKCFRIDPNGCHVLIRDDWGGAFDSYRGRAILNENALYERRASSNGGGCGYDYAIFPRDWKYCISVDDI
jgi:hypothetical protein